MHYTGESSIFDYVNKGILPSGKHTIVVGSTTLNVEVVRIDGHHTHTPGATVGDWVADTHMLMLVVEGKLTIQAGATLTPLTRKKGFLIFAREGIDNYGVISMTARGAIAAGDNVNLVKNVNGGMHTLSAAGGAGGASFYTTTTTDALVGNSGKSPTGIACGGGGTGGIYRGANARYEVRVGKGGNGTTYSGGAGSGGASVRDKRSGYGNNSGAGAENGGAGGRGFAYRYDNGQYFTAGGGAGNPGGRNDYYGSKYEPYADNGATGTGGLLIICGKYINNRGSFLSIGSDGGDANSTYRGVGGGASGGGAIVSIYEDSIVPGTVDVRGGYGGYGKASGYGYPYGGDGGRGYYGAIRAFFTKEGAMLSKKGDRYIFEGTTLLKIKKGVRIKQAKLKAKLMKMNFTLNGTFNAINIQTNDKVTQLNQKPLNIRLSRGD